MIKNKVRIHFILALTTVILVTIQTTQLSYAEELSPETINATIKIAVCGDNVVEDPEECEGEDLDEATCESLGYASGTLSCDPSCAFDESKCIPKPVSPSGDDDSDSDGEDDSDNIESSNTTQELKQLVQEIMNQILPKLPVFVYKLDINNNGSLDKEELYEVVRGWVLSWIQLKSKEQVVEEVTETASSLDSSSCDLDGDGSCSLVDFSVLLYYVGR